MTTIALAALLLAGALLAVAPTAAAACDQGGIGQKTGCKVDSTFGEAAEAVKEISCIWVSCP